MENLQSATIIIARFNEDITWAENLAKDNPQMDFLITNKGEYLPDIKWCFQTLAPNIGREGETFLRYIIEEYYQIEDFTIFLQGNPFDHDPLILDFFKKPFPNEIVLLGEMFTSDKDGAPHHPGLKVSETFTKIFGYEKHFFPFCPGAQYCIPKEFILNKSFQWWKDLYNIYMETPDAPWVFERLWLQIFNYQQ